MQTTVIDPSAAASTLLRAWQSGELLDALPTGQKPETLGQGYDIQEQMFVGSGGVRGGWKLGVGSPAALKGANLTRALAGQLDRARLHRSGAHLRLPAYTPVTIECEIAFVLDRDLPPLPGRKVESADIRSTCVTFEVVRSRFVNRKTVGWPSFAADNVGFEALIVGEPLYQGLDLDAMRALAETVVVYLDGEPRAKGLFDDTATDPSVSLAALYEHAAERGQTLHAGDVITTGAMCEPFDLTGEGYELSARFFDQELTFSI